MTNNSSAELEPGTLLKSPRTKVPLTCKIAFTTPVVLTLLGYTKLALTDTQCTYAYCTQR